MWFYEILHFLVKHTSYLVEYDIDMTNVCIKCFTHSFGAHILLQTAAVLVWMIIMDGYEPSPSKNVR